MVKKTEQGLLIVAGLLGLAMLSSRRAGAGAVEEELGAVPYMGQSFGGAATAPPAVVAAIPPVDEVRDYQGQYGGAGYPGWVDPKLETQKIVTVIPDFPVVATPTGKTITPIVPGVEVEYDEEGYPITDPVIINRSAADWAQQVAWATRLGANVITSGPGSFDWATQQAGAAGEDTVIEVTPPEPNGPPVVEALIPPVSAAPRFYEPPSGLVPVRVSSWGDDDGDDQDYSYADELGMELEPQVAVASAQDWGGVDRMDSYQVGHGQYGGEE